MDARWGRLAARAANQHTAFCIADMEAVGISPRMRSDALRTHLIERIGPKTFRFATDRGNWHQLLSAALLDLGPQGVLAGRAGAALLGLDGFPRQHVEALVPRELRGRRIAGIVASTSRPIDAIDVCRIEGLRCLRAERLIIEAALFRFTKEEIENAIDSAARLGLVSDVHLRERIERERCIAVNGSRGMVDALVDAGGHTRLERAFLKLIRIHRLPRPKLQVVHKEGTRTIARVDAFFGHDLVVEVDGHATHSSRRQRRKDAQRHTELTLLGRRVLTFTSDDVWDRPGWVAAQVRAALSGNHAQNRVVF
jgi:very-short-patch-repair endonuclease